ncbi:ATP-binding protein [Vibrio europaeus]|uniref:histidine kinase n=1 Tax=Vibrio europaeus TaxID=300876 RepID=A0A178J736_9VIBR|nr:ATP-binding protein [Vibrio europaeus]MDC5705259.1 ATP-binding protein [Vibrio europaeus]MDC5710538.1 ATP-binding protein [Vibrio europaeus]MDC5715628.1 ATP-binding protein [Vibrio europaeus]MDC5719789.1 ATP-binding protein [Vibrio europaeus]MDC5724323.1 ATP-binding protein [Vibrio europaeus]
MADKELISLLWLLGCTCIALFMQAGFTLIETGSVRAKNSVNVAMKNLADFIVVTVAYIVFGYHLSQGDSLLSFETLAMDNEHLPKLLFNVMFVTTAATIVSGCVAERMSYKGYIYTSFFIAVITYPIASYLTWNPYSWLNSSGFYDFAGGTTVHVVGGMIGLIGTMIVGPRKGRFDKKSVREIPSYSHTLVTLGVFLMLFAWLGFNGGSLYTFDLRVPKILFNTLVCGAIAGCTTLFWLHHYRHVPVFVVLNSVLGGLVIVTAGADIMGMIDLLVLGMFASACVILGDRMLIKAKIDDPVGAIPVHLFCGGVGTLYAGFKLGWIENQDVVNQLLMQVIGLVIVAGWAALNAATIFMLLRKMHLDRVTEREEEVGLNFSEHGVRMSWLETVNTIEQISQHGDYSRRVPIEFGTEAGDVAISFNNLMDRLESNIDVLHQVAKGNLEDLDVTPSSDRDIMSNSLKTMILGLRSLIDDVEGQLQKQASQGDPHTLQALIERFKRTQDQLMEAEKMSALSGMVVGVAHELNTPLGVSVTSLSILNDRLFSIQKSFQDKTISQDDLTEFLSVANQCMEMLITNINRSVELVSKLKSVDQKMTVEEPKLIELSQLFRDVLTHTEELFDEHNISARLECDEKLRVYVAPISLACVIEELLTNSALHAFSGELHSQREVRLVASQDHQNTYISVEDNGNGISEQDQSKIFQPFFTTLRARGGTGLGMHMVYNICSQKLAANIELESTLGVGTKFVITLENRIEPEARAPA